MNHSVAFVERSSRLPRRMRRAASPAYRSNHIFSFAVTTPRCGGPSSRVTAATHSAARIVAGGRLNEVQKTCRPRRHSGNAQAMSRCVPDSLSR
jgi:hypothetical protein